MSLAEAFIESFGGRLRWLAKRWKAERLAGSPSRDSIGVALTRDERSHYPRIQGVRTGLKLIRDILYWPCEKHSVSDWPPRCGPAVTLFPPPELMTSAYAQNVSR